MKYDETYRGRVYSLKDGVIYNWNENGRMAGTGILNGGSTSVTLNGYTVTTQSGNVMYQTVGGGYIDLKDGWQEVGTQYVATYSQSEAQKQVDTIIRNNKTILENNLLCARFVDKMTKDEVAAIYQLQKNLQIRNERLQADGFCSGLSTSYPQGYSRYDNYLKQLIDDYETGKIGSLTLTIIVTAVVIASLSTAAYFTYRYYALQSESDVKFSNDLTKTLTSKLTEEEYNQLKKETAGLITKAKIKAKLGTWSTWLIGLGIFFGGMYLYRRYGR